jgi:hypothetical protein
VASAFEKEFVDAKMHASAPAELRKTLVQRLKSYFGDKAVLGLPPSSDAAAAFVAAAAAAFFDQDLLRAAQMLLSNAKGSFGLFVSCSLDAHRQIVLAARGQTMSVAFYPAQNLVLWASEQVRAPAQRIPRRKFPAARRLLLTIGAGPHRAGAARRAGRRQGSHPAGRWTASLLGAVRSC